MNSKVITSDELKEHNKEDDLWISVYGTVYDVTNFKEHPGTFKPLLHFAGSDATPGFQKVHPNVDIMSVLNEATVKGRFVNTDKLIEDYLKGFKDFADQIKTSDKYDQILASFFDKIKIENQIKEETEKGTETETKE